MIYIQKDKLEPLNYYKWTKENLEEKYIYLPVQDLKLAIEHYKNS